jgi:hypothetical protein
MLMPRAKWLSLVLLFTALLALTGVVSAQYPQPVVLKIDGDLWAWEAKGQPLTQLTDWGHNHNPTLSPDGTRIAYTSYASIFTDWLQRVQGAGGFLPPENIWILDLPSRQTFRIADQPADASYNGPVDAGTYTMRQGLSWSPDGGRVAWIEISATPESALGDGQYTNRIAIMVYDLASRATLFVDSFSVTGESPRAGVDRYGLGWNESGIVLETRPPQFSGEASTYRLYSLMGGIHNEMTAASGYTGAIHHNGEEYLFNSRSPEQWLNWETGETEPIAGRLELYSPTTPMGAIFYLVDGEWYLELPGQTPLKLAGQVQPYGISRDGQAVLYGRYEIDPATGAYAYTVILHWRYDAVKIGHYEDIVALSGPMAWRVAED